MTKITVTIDNIKYEFDSIEEAHKAFPAFVDIEKDMNEVFDKTDKVFALVDEAFDMVDTVFKKIRKAIRRF